MPKVLLKQSFVDNPPLPTDKPKIQYFDEKLTGFILEVRRNGKATYYLRYRDKHSKIRQQMIGPTDSMSVDQAREKAKALKSQLVMGFDPLAHVEKIKKTPTFREFTRDKYLPHVKTYKRSWDYDQKMIEMRMIKLWGNMRMDEFRPGDLLEFQSALVNQGFKPGSVNRVMALGELFDPLDYPIDPAERFSFHWQYVNLAMPGNSQLLSPILYEREREKFLNLMEETRDQAITALRTEFAELVSHLTDRLGTNGDSKPKILRSSVLQKLNEFLDNFSNRNLFEDEELQSLVRLTRDIITGVDTEFLRDNKALRESIRQDMAEVKNAIDKSITDLPRRRIYMEAA